MTNSPFHSDFRYHSNIKKIKNIFLNYYQTHSLSVILNSKRIKIINLIAPINSTTRLDLEFQFIRIIIKKLENKIKIVYYLNYNRKSGE